ncbi:hypothetical protein COL26b_012468 [Colletotrichum chrysophilum]|uniref:uncharacterized protein n=1 Tax=Colletotrichum chrysophilum TaxID=1836956 RepID=UPI0023016C2A|nr:uncharacterized protein COL26b_012468 [Colletotrichum chrysophilum]KAJ0364638.1 hypothetical protein COL26b_012468 [Colletotrichum chrysophilum]
MGKNHLGKNARLRAKKRMLRATQALLNGTATTTDDDPLAGLTNTQRTKKRVRQATQQRLNGIKIRTQADAAVMKHTMDQAIEENKDWRLRVETRVAAGHNALQDHVKREGVKMEIVGAKMEMVNQDMGDLRQKIVELETQLQQVRDDGAALRAEFQQLRDSVGREGGSQQEGANEEGWKGRLRSRKKA